MNINYFPCVYSHLDNLFTLMFVLQFSKYAEDMNSQVFAELPTSTVVSDTSLLQETLLHLHNAYDHKKNRMLYMCIETFNNIFIFAKSSFTTRIKVLFIQS